MQFGACATAWPSHGDVMENALTMLYSPFPSRKDARKVAEALVDETLVACCNILPGAESHYRWQGKHVVAKEWILIAKTHPLQAQACLARIAALHPYSTPAILSLEAMANPAFAAWVTAALGQNTLPHSQ